jgi:hypothetical protein
LYEAIRLATPWAVAVLYDTVLTFAADVLCAAVVTGVAAVPAVVADAVEVLFAAGVAAASAASAGAV